MSRGLPSFEVKTLSTIMKELGHKWVDVLKIDIEGNEWPVLEQMVTDKRPLMFTQMQVGYLTECSTWVLSEGSVCLGAGTLGRRGSLMTSLAQHLPALCCEHAARMAC